MKTKVTFELDTEAARDYMAHAADKRVEDLPLWVALSLCLAEYKRQMEPKTSTKDLIDEFIRKELKGDTDGQS